MPIRVFVSHSTNIDKNEPVDMVHPDHSQFLRDLCEQLKAAKTLRAAPAGGEATDYEKLRADLEKLLRAAVLGESEAVHQAKARQEAERLLEHGLDGVTDLIRREGLIDPHRVLTIIELIAPWWVDPTSSGVLARDTGILCAHDS
jgi:hypothetical protein